MSVAQRFGHEIGVPPEPLVALPPPTAGGDVIEGEPFAFPPMG